MNCRNAALVALLVSSPLSAQAPAGVVDYGVAVPLSGNWTYATASDGSDASFTDANAQLRMKLHCARPTRVVSIAIPASAASPTVSIWTSAGVRALAASFDASAMRLKVQLAAYDQLLDWIPTSRGRFAATPVGQPPVVVPPWSEVARVIEDCRV